MYLRTHESTSEPHEEIQLKDVEEEIKFLGLPEFHAEKSTVRSGVSKSWMRTSQE